MCNPIPTPRPHGKRREYHFLSLKSTARIAKKDPNDFFQAPSKLRALPTLFAVRMR